MTDSRPSAGSTRLAVLAVAMSAILLSACGGEEPSSNPFEGSGPESGSEASSEEGGAVAEAEYNNAVADIINEGAQEQSDYEQTGDPEDAAVFQLDLYDRMIPELEALSPPSSMADLHRELLRVYRLDREVTAEALDAVRAGDDAKVQALVAKSQEIQGEMTDLAEELYERATPGQ